MDQNTEFILYDTYPLKVKCDETIEKYSNKIKIPFYIFNIYIENHKGPYNVLLTSNEGDNIYCNVIEKSPKNELLVSSYIYETLKCKKNVFITLCKDKIPKGEIIQIQPCSKRFIEIKNLDKQLEKLLSNFSVIFVHQKITLVQELKTYDFLITNLIIEKDIKIPAISLCGGTVKLDLHNPFLEEIEADIKKNKNSQNSEEEKEKIVFNYKQILGCEAEKYDYEKIKNLRKKAYDSL